ncbi:Flagellar assembly protein FliH [Buchnera aphidicola (Eriosoma lanigerum)]|uniref:FliH/SctL family protein n=1 Tax=Buchnera aphidicola TaxID=9 RepID=UPI003464E598
MFNTIIKKKWKKWYPNELNKSNKQNTINSDLDISLQKNDKDTDDQFSSQLHLDDVINVDANQSLIDINTNKNVNTNNAVNSVSCIEIEQEMEIFKREKEKFYVTIKDFLDSFKYAIDMLDQSIANHLMEVVLKVTEKVINSSPVLEKEVLLNMIKKFLNQDIIFLKSLKLHIHPDNQLLVEEKFQTIFSSYGWKIICDQTVDINSCKFSSDEGSEFDGSILARFHAITRSLFNEE